MRSKPLLRRVGQQLAGDGAMFLGDKAQAVQQTLDLEFGLLDPPEDLDLLLAREQGHAAHLVHVHLNGVVQRAVLAFFLGLNPIGGGPLDLSGGGNLHAEFLELGVQAVQVIGRHSLGQKLVDVVVSEVALFAGQEPEALDRFAEIPGRPRCRRGSGGVAGNANRPWPGGGPGGGFGPKDEWTGRPVGFPGGFSLFGAGAICWFVVQMIQWRRPPR